MRLCVLAPLRETLVVLLSLVAAMLCGSVHAVEPTVETVLKDLRRPCGVAARPGGTADRYEVFFAESGAGRVVRWSNQSPQQVSPVITDFASNAAADPFQQTGPLALAFLDPGLLVVGATADKHDGILQTYELPDDGAALSANSAGRATVGDESSRPAPSLACSAFARTRANGFVTDMLVLAVRTGDDGGQLMKARVQAGILGAPRPFGPTDGAVSPRAVATSRSGHIVVGDIGGGLKFYNPIDGKVELALETELPQLTAIAYSPTTSNLYAADFAGGIYRLDDVSGPGHPACRTVKVADVKRPTGLTFAPDGSLYVVTFGSNDNDGTLEIVTGDL